ncbi:transcription factor bHLH143-like [Salvia hispanica]|uniref:transcription factor bHLH143-like n=1 Tax=Salvia hispanica TaxID=49212 RepID=UPI002009050A|nr:transcription factor bHLH143-like [Salvia hispanica]
MAAARESQLRQQFAVRNSSYIDHMATPHLDRNLSLPHFPSYQWPTANATFPGQYAPDLNAFGGFRPPQCNIPCPTGEPYLKGSQCALPRGLGVVDKQPVGAPQRRFLIFDQSENHTRLFLGPSFSPLDKMFASKTPVPLDKATAHVDPRILSNPAFEEKWDENHLSEEEGGETYEEDSDDIDALLYSDTDSDDDDEVTSSEHSPPLSLDELTEEITSPAPKRRKLLDGKHEKSSLESHDEEDDDVMESRCASDDDSGKKIKIREALKVLESIIPGLDGSDPVSIIDGAVAYLKAMKSSLGGA